MALKLLSGAIINDEPAKVSIGGLSHVSETYSLDSDTYTITANDTIHMLNLEKGTRLVDGFLTVDDLDTSTGVKLDLKLVGSESSITILSQSTIGQTGGIARAAQNIPVLLAEDMKLIVAFQTAPSAQKSGDITTTILAEKVN